MRGLVAFVVLALLVGLGGQAAAEGNPEVAKRLFAEGRVLYDQGKYIEACVLFEKSYQLDPAVGTKLNLAECAERDNKPRAAWLLWVSAADEFRVASDSREKFARDRADALGPKLATVAVRVAKPKQEGLTIQIAGREVVPAFLIIDRLDPGAISVTASAPGREPFQTTVTIALGGRVEVDIPALPKLGGKADDDTPKRGRNHWWTGAIATGVVAVASFGMSFYFNNRISTIESELAVLIDQANMGTAPPDAEQRVADLNDQGEAAEKGGNVSFLVGVVASVATVALVVKAVRTGKRRDAAATAWRLSPVVGPETAGASFELRW